MATLKECRAALKAAFPGADLAMYRAPHGYYYFDSVCGVPSLCVYRLDAVSTDFIVAHVRPYVEAVDDAIAAHYRAQSGQPASVVRIIR